MERVSFHTTAMIGGVVACLWSIGCGEKSSSDEGRGALSTEGPQPDLMLRGKRFVWVQKANYVTPPKELPVQAAAPDHVAPLPTAEQLAEGMRARILMNGHEYLQAEPDVELARTILANPIPPTTPASDDVAASADGDVEQKQGAYIIGSDERTRVYCLRLSHPAKTKAHYTTGCSATMIGDHTAAIAAHCLYNNGYFALGTFTPAADTGDVPMCPATAPFGTPSIWFTAVPSGWNDDEWFYDYGFIEFNNPVGVGWMGTSPPPTLGNITTLFQGYPGDKPYQQFWGQSGSASCTTGFGSGQNCYSTMRLHHLFDVIPGQSGAGMIRTSDNALYAIQSTQNSSCVFWSCDRWNEARIWASDTYNFVHSFGLWP